MARRATRVVAAFDVDGTLTRRDTLLPFLLTVAGAGSFGRVVAVRSPALGVALVAGGRARLKAQLIEAVIGGRSRRAVLAAGEAFADTLLAGGLRPDAIGRLRDHQRAGHQVVLVSASLDAYLEPLGRRLGVDAVLCSRLDVDRNGVLSGRLAGADVRGAEKVVRLRRWLDDQPHVLLAYGNSDGDRELLAAAAQAWRRTARGWHQEHDGFSCSTGSAAKLPAWEQIN